MDLIDGKVQDIMPWVSSDTLKHPLVNGVN